VSDRHDDLAAQAADAARRSPLRIGPTFSQLADDAELRYREEIERVSNPTADVTAWIERKELPHLLAYALERAAIEPHGTVVELGAGTCWMGAELAKRPRVERVLSVEFSRRRLELLAPVAIAYLGAPAEKIERVLADFYSHGLGTEIADFVFTDAAYHHAADPVALARVAFDLLKPGGLLVLHREPTLSFLRRTRDHHEEGKHGDFEHEYFRRRYVEQLREAGFERAAWFPASIGTSPWRRAWLRPPLSWLNGVVFGSYTYVGWKGAATAPDRALPAREPSRA
jgi:SAM-dependent methyltransferase